jgi:nitrite reductase (NAD(P)H)
MTNVVVKDITTYRPPSGGEVFDGFDLNDGTHIPAELVIFAIGIKPRDDLARAGGLECHPKGGIVIGVDLKTSAKDVYAIGECANWRGNTYGLIAPGGLYLSFGHILSY